MASTSTGIEWTDATWNVLRGCTRVSLGCGGPHGQGGCYAERLAIRLSAPGQPYHGLVKSTPDGPRWTGEVRFVEEALALPLRWTKPRRIFVNSMSDLFHEKVLIGWTDLIFAVMALAPQHTFQVLTKRPAAMLSYLTDQLVAERVDTAAHEWRGQEDELTTFTRGRWPLPNVHLGVSVENQATADERLPLLLRTPAAVRWVSYEPALGPVDFERRGWLSKGRGRGPIGINPGCYDCAGMCEECRPLDWVVIGGESGPGARPFDLAWARSAIAQCRSAGVPCFFKQAGSDPYQRTVFNDAGRFAGGVKWPKLRDRKGGDLSELPADLHVREFPR